MNKNSPDIGHEFLTVGTIVAFFVIIPLFIFQVLPLLTVKSQAQSEPSFTFTAAGDYGGNSRTTAVLTGMNPANSGANFNLALGDLSYSSKTPETAWCDYVKSKAGDTHPFELIPGNHEDNETAGNSIDNFALCLPDLIGGLTGRYSREYYFDFPLVSPIARFINISPNLTFLDEGTYSYTAGSTHYNWVVNAIDSARTAGIRWIVVGMHKNCITMGVKSCAIGESLFNLLVEKRVDLILQAHEHNYQRSKQLALNPSCTGIVPGSYNAGCVADDGADNTYTKDAGSVLAIAGTGGAGLYDINLADGEAGYFVKWMGNNINPTWGFLKASVTSTQMTLSFERQTGGTFTDNFTIVDNSLPTVSPVPPTDTPIPTPTPTIDPFAPTPTETPAPTLTPIPTDTPIPSVTPIPTNTPVPTSTPIATPAPAVLTLNPIADAAVLSNKPDKNYGTSTTLQIDGVPVKIALLKFDLSTLSGRSVLSANLRLYVSNSSNSTQVVKDMTDTSWQETLVTYNNRPALGNAVSSFTGGAIGTWKVIPVTSAVAAKTGQLMSLGIDSTGADGLDTYTRENGINKPELVITLE